MINQWVFGLVILEDVIVKRERYWALGFQFLSRKYVFFFQKISRKYVDAGVRVLFGVLRSQLVKIRIWVRAFYGFDLCVSLRRLGFRGTHSGRYFGRALKQFIQIIVVINNGTNSTIKFYYKKIIKNWVNLKMCNFIF